MQYANNCSEKYSYFLEGFDRVTDQSSSDIVSHNAVGDYRISDSGYTVA